MQGGDAHCACGTRRPRCTCVPSCNAGNSTRRWCANRASNGNLIREQLRSSRASYDSNAARAANGTPGSTAAARGATPPIAAAGASYADAVADTMARCSQVCLAPGCNAACCDCQHCLLMPVHWHSHGLLDYFVNELFAPAHNFFCCSAPCIWRAALHSSAFAESCPSLNAAQSMHACRAAPAPSRSTLCVVKAAPCPLAALRRSTFSCCRRGARHRTRPRASCSRCRSGA